MQRTFLTGCILIAFAAAVQAQNTSTLNQIGTNQTGVINQTGSNNITTIRQLTGTGATANTGNVAQVRQNAFSTLPTTNQAFIDQINGADYNEANILQTAGSGNVATIQQNGADGFRSGGTALFRLAGGSTVGNLAFITQTGAGNDQTEIKQNAGVMGRSQANYASVEQYGNGNLSTFVEQSNLSVGNFATIDQGTSANAATGNSAVVQQLDNSQFNTAEVSQSGTAKVAEIRQTTAASLNTALSRQTGLDGFVYIYQVDNATGNRATVDQMSTSAGATASIYQTDQSAYNQATIEQAGTADAALVNQSTQAKNGVATIRQGSGGMANTAVITQTYTYDGDGSTTYGTGSQATIEQNLTTPGSTGNVAEVTQGFADGLSPITGNAEVSDDNRALVSQENDGNVTKLLQGGIGNRATTAQQGYSTIKGVDNGLTVNDVAQQIGNNNVLNVTQAGTITVSNQANIFQTGNFNTSTISQTAQMP